MSRVTTNNQRFGSTSHGREDRVLLDRRKIQANRHEKDFGLLIRWMTTPVAHRGVFT